MMSLGRLCKHLLVNSNLHLVCQHQSAHFSSQRAKAFNSSCTALPFQNDQEEIRFMRKYKRKLQDILCSDVNEQLSIVRIKGLVNSCEDRALTVFWSLEKLVPDDVSTQKIGAILQANSKIIKQKLESGNAYRKLPRLQFVQFSPDDQLDKPRDQSDYRSCEITKPNAVYGLTWSEYVERVKAKTDGDTVTVNGKGENSLTNGGVVFHKNSTIKWAKAWREHHNAKLISKRDRKRSHQSLGLWNLEKEMEELD